MGRFVQQENHSDLREWFPYCLDYRLLLDKLTLSYDPMKNYSDSLLSDDIVISNQLDELSIFSELRQRFFAASLKTELDEIFKFYSCNVAQSTLMLSSLEDDANGFRVGKKVIQVQADELFLTGSETEEKDLEKAKTHVIVMDPEDPYSTINLKKKAVEIYEACQRLLKFKMLNYDACRRLIAVQARSTVPSNYLMAERELMMFLLSHPLFTDSELGATVDGVEKMYATLFCHGNIEVAREALSFKVSTSKNPWDYKLGLRLGITAVLFIWVLWDCIVDPSMGKNAWKDPAFKVYRGLGNCVLLVWTWGINLQVWRANNIDYGRILELSPREHNNNPCGKVWSVASELSIAWLISFICFYKSLRGVFLDTIPPQFAHMFPLLLFLYMGHRMVFPWKERYSMWVNIYNTVAAPFAQVHFKEGYVGDVLTSTVRVMIDLAFALLWFLSGVNGWLQSNLDLEAGNQIETLWLFRYFLVPGITAAPLYWRFMQNIHRAWETQQRWPHLGNAMKYASAQTVALFGVFHPELRTNSIWISAFVFATVYQYTWDIFMDWDLLHWSADGSSLELRKTLMYKTKGFYIAIAVINLILRFLWTITLIPEANHNLFTEKFDLNLYLSPFIAAAEICRRSMWGFLRVENEHIQVIGTREEKTTFAVKDLIGEKEPQSDSLVFDKDSFRPMQVKSTKESHPHVDQQETSTFDCSSVSIIDFSFVRKLIRSIGAEMVFRQASYNPRLFLELALLSIGILAVSLGAAHVSL